MTIVIDGKSLLFCLEDEILNKIFFIFGCRAASVICCRVSPKQKADIVRLSKDNGNATTLAIGDGSNDVPMIMEGHVGVGIRGQEGTQAIRAADYSISQFKFLQNLFLNHGRLGYKRVSNFICYYFYKNVILVFCEIYFVFVNGYSAQIYFVEWLPMLYNAVWTSWPCLFTYTFERDITPEFSLVNPVLYQAGHKDYYLNYQTFWKWMVMALYHGFIAYFIPIYASGPAVDSTG
jgi:magnesium-transporting ATPase (P-type)